MGGAATPQPVNAVSRRRSPPLVHTLPYPRVRPGRLAAL
jgi:hypothetical protein